MKTLATHPELVRAWLLALGGMPPAPQPVTPFSAPSSPVPPERQRY